MSWSGRVGAIRDVESRSGTSCGSSCAVASLSSGADLRNTVLVTWVGRLAAGIVGATLCGCTAAPPSAELAIVQSQAPAAGTCALSPGVTRERIREGTFDLALGDRSSYTLTPVVRNRRADEVVVATARVEVYEEHGSDSVRLHAACGQPEDCSSWDLDLCEGGCPVVPAGDTASFEVPILPRLVTWYYQSMIDDAVRSGRVPPEFRLRSSVTLVGSAGGREVVSPPFAFVTTLCLGCLVAFPDGSDAPELPGPDCCGAGAPARSCYPGQDAPIDCRDCIRTLPEICNFGRTSCGL